MAGATGTVTAEMPPPPASTSNSSTPNPSKPSTPVLPNLHLPASVRNNAQRQPTQPSGPKTQSASIPTTAPPTLTSSDGPAHPPLPSLDPASSAMVLSRLQNLTNSGGTPGLALPNGSASSTADPSQQQQPGNLSDFFAQLQNFVPPNPNAHNLDPSNGMPNTAPPSSLPNQPPAFVSASQLHPPTTGVPPSATAPGLSTNAPGWNTSASDNSSQPRAKKSNAPSRQRSESPPPSQAGPSNASLNKQIPAFLNKLRNMVDDKGTDELICWQPNGKTFIVPNNIRFAKEVLPRFFKHNNFSSFVRQLNMYGFHKVPSLQQGSLKHEQEMEVWEFENDNFVRSNPELMANVQRKRGQKGDGEKDGHDKDDENDRNKALIDGKVEEGLNSISGALMRTGESESLTQLNNVWHAIQSIQNSQTTINDNLRHLHMSNDKLWQDAMESKQRADQQADTINKMLQFLAGVFGSQDVLSHADSDGTPTKGRNKSSRPQGNLFRNHSGGPLMIGDARQSESNPSINRGSDNNERIQELFSRFSEEAGSNENTPRGSRSPPETSSPRITKLASPATNSAPFSPVEGESTPTQSNWHDGQAVRRPSTPGGGRAKISGNQILGALQHIFSNQAGNSHLQGGSGIQRPGTPGGAKFDPAVLSSIQSIFSLIQNQQGGGAGSNGQDVNRFLHPYNGGAGASQVGDANSIGNALSQYLEHTNQTQHDADALQRAIGALASAAQAGGIGANEAPGPGAVARPGTPGLFPAGALPTGSTPHPSGTAAPGDWNQFAGLTPTSGFAGGPAGGPAGDGGNSDLSSDFDMDALLSQFISSSPGPSGSQHEMNPMDDSNLNHSAAASPRVDSGASTGAAVPSPPAVGSTGDAMRKKRQSSDPDQLQRIPKASRLEEREGTNTSSRRASVEDGE